MKKNDFASWIDIVYKSHYLDSKYQGLHLVFRDGVSNKVREITKKYLSFLRKRYFFPIRCYIYLTNNKKYISNSKGHCYGVFFGAEENKNKLPSIYLPAKESKNNSMVDLLLNLTKLITYYFQWYFLLEKERSHRSLEIEATKMANYLVFDFLEQNSYLLDNQ